MEPRRNAIRDPSCAIRIILVLISKLLYSQIKLREYKKMSIANNAYLIGVSIMRKCYIVPLILIISGNTEMLVEILSNKAMYVDIVSFAA